VRAVKSSINPIGRLWEATHETEDKPRRRKSGKRSDRPVRLQENLMQAAKLTGERFHRSTAEQIEYWADIGRKVSTYPIGRLWEATHETEDKPRR
jgi:hypothetical protein